MTELFASLAPAILILFIIRYLDRKNPEPKKQMAIGVFYGVLSTLLSLCFTEFVIPFAFCWISWASAIPIVSSFYSSFIDAALPEETAKLIMLWLLLRKNKYYDEYFDGIVYAVCVGMGFAGFENVLYVVGDEDWQSVALMRAFLSVPGHYMFAVLMGLFYSLVHFNPERFGKYKWMVLIAPILAHGIYDTICDLAGTLPDFLGIIIEIGLILFCIKLHIYCAKKMKNIKLFDQDRYDLEAFEKGMSNY